MKRNDPTFDSFQEKYPNLFKEYPRCGFYVGKGWLPLLHTLCTVIESTITNLPEEIRGEIYCDQVKEKFAGLRFSMNQTTPFINGAIALAESISFSICEDCGAAGHRRTGGWHRTLCDHCHFIAQEHNKAIVKKFDEQVKNKRAGKIK